MSQDETTAPRVTRRRRQTAERVPTPADLGMEPPPPPPPTQTIVQPGMYPDTMPPVRPAARLVEPELSGPWEVLRRRLDPEVFQALLQVMPNAPVHSTAEAPWFECWDPAEGRPTGHPHFQARAQPGQHVLCPYSDPVTGRLCNRQTVMPLENYVSRVA